MTPRARRLSRLLGLRTIELRMVARRLGVASETAAAMAAVARQIDALRIGSAAPAGATGGYAIKAAAATAAVLAATATRHATRRAEVERAQVALSGEVRRRHAATDAIAAVIATEDAIAAVIAAEDAIDRAGPRR